MINVIRSTTNVNSSSVSSDNSTTTALNDGQSFTGTWENIDGIPSLIVSCKTDADCDMYVDFSPDGTNADSTLSYEVSANTPEIHRLVAGRRYFRVRIENNSGSNQSFLRLQVMKGSYEPLASPDNLSLGLDADAITVRPDDYFEEVVLGKRAGKTAWNKWGYNTDIDTTTDPEIIASFGGTFSRMTSADTLDIVSSSTSDTNGGVGANTILITGIDQNRVAQTESITMNGTTTVTTTNQWLGVNRIAITLAGTSEVNVGTISVTATTAGSTQAEVPAGSGVTQQAIFHVQADATFLVEWALINVNRISGGSTPSVTVKGWVYSAVSNSKYEVFRATIESDTENNLPIVLPIPFPIREKSILYFTGETDTNNTFVSVRFSGTESRVV